MHVALLALGLVSGLAGIVLVAVGIRNHGAALGGTLIIAGTMAIVGGLVMVGLGSAIRQLRRIAKALEARPGALGLAPAEAEPRLPMPIIAAAPLAASGSAGESGHSPRSEPTIEPPRASERDTPREREQPAAEPRAEPDLRHLHVPPPEARNTFDAIWSTRPSAERGQAVAQPAATEEVNAPASEPEVTIFKSGVIDGMAYTLYTDGSIEAELSHGTVKFSSIDELRAYLAARE